MEVKYQVFVSSTFVDLEEERRKVTEAILNLGHIPVGMEGFQASDDNQWEYIRRRISECDYYVVIVGERYGSEFEGKSYTQMEYELAIEKGLPVAAFLMSDQARSALPRDRVQFDKADQIKAFRDLCQMKLCKHWDNASDLASKVLLALVELTRERPMRGWVRPSSVPAEDVLQEMSILLEKNRELQAIVDRLDGGSSLVIPSDVTIRIEELSQLKLSTYAPDPNNYDHNATLLDVFLAASRPLSIKCDYMDFSTLLNDEFELEDDGNQVEEIMAEFSMRKLVDVGTKISPRSSTTIYTLTEYGKDFLLCAQQWIQSQTTEPLFGQR